jgi:hypothetical protein
MDVVTQSDGESSTKSTRGGAILMAVSADLPFGSFPSLEADIANLRYNMFVRVEEDEARHTSVYIA